MANNKKLVVEIDANTGKFAAKLKEIPKSVEGITTSFTSLSEKYKLLNSLGEAQSAILKQFESSILRIKSLNLNEAFKEGAIAASLNSARKPLTLLAEEIAKVKKEISTLTYPTSQSSDSGKSTYVPNQQGTIANNRAAYDKAANEAYASHIKSIQEQITRKNKEELDKQDFATKASYNSRYVMYAAMFDQIAAKQSKTDFSKLGENTFKPKSDYGIALTRGLSEAGKTAELDKQKAASIALLRQEEEAVKKATVAHRSLAESVVLSTLYYKAFTFTLQKTKEGLFAIPKIGIQLESTIASLSSTIGTAAGAASAIKAINQEAERTGLTISALRESFKTFQASTALAGESLDSTWRMFTNINTVATALHLTTDQTNHVFLALAQIFNKTKVQSEELVKQLGNLLPGAFASFAAANKDLFVNSADLINKMKQGVVTAHDTIEKFTDFMAKRFTEAFAVASVGLNSEIGRMQNAFTLLGETIYKANRGPLIEIVKGITNLTNALNDDINGANNFYNALKQITTLSFAVFAGAAINKLFLMKNAITGATVAARALEGSLAFLKGPQLVITGIVLIATELYELAKASNASRTAVLDFYESLGKAKEEAAKTKLTLSVEDDPGVVKFRENITKVQQDIAKYQTILDKAEKRKKVSLFDIELPQEKEARVQLKLAQAQELDLIEQLEKQKQVVREEMQLKANTANADQLDEYAKKRRALEIDREQALGNDIIAARMQTEDRYQAMLTDARRTVDQVSKVPSFLRSEDSQKELEQATKDIEDIQLVISKAGTSIKKEAKDNIKAIEDELQVNKETQAKLLEDNENNLKLNIVSYETFFKRKLDLYQNDYEARKFLLSKQLEEARDPVKSSDISGKLRELDIEQERRVSALKLANVETIKQRTSELASIQQEYYKIIGDEETSLKQQYKERFGTIKTYLEDQIELGNENAKILLNQLNLIQEIGVFEAKSSAAKIENQSKENQYQQALERINILKNTGALSELQANIEIARQNEKEIETKQQAIYLAQQELDLIKERDGDKSNRYKQGAEDIRKMTEELENFKLTANTVGQYFQGILTPAFSNAFSGFITGSMSAKEAFSSFGQSIMKTLADIAAQELSKQLLGMAISFAGSLTGGGFSGNGPLMSYQNAWANGGVGSGLGIGNGTVLTQPTYFPNAKVIPFASGGVVAGEAGAEAALPLKRLRNGKLGVQTEGSSSSGNAIIVQNMNITLESKNDTTSAEQAKMVGEAVKANLKILVQQEMVSAKRPGGTYNPTAIAASF